MRLDVAYSQVLEAFPRIEPNLGFLRQLKRFENQVVIKRQFNDPIQKFACKRCRVTLFTHLDIINHTLIKSKLFKKGKRSWEGGKSFCSSIFVTQMAWMGEITSNDGRLTCPRCTAKLGSYLLSGIQCSCGRFVNPAFQMHLSR